jgi:hypothetical protein
MPKVDTLGARVLRAQRSELVAGRAAFSIVRQERAQAPQHGS